MIASMKLFIAASYSAKVDYATGQVEPKYREWLESLLTMLEQQGHTVFCALRADQYRINNADPAAAFKLDIDHLDESEAILALITDQVSAGVQTEIGYAIAANKKVILVHSEDDKIAFFNAAMIKAKVAQEVMLPAKTRDLPEIIAAALKTK